MPVSTLYPWERRWLAVFPTTDALLLPYEIDRAGYVSLHRWSRGRESQWLGYSLDELTERHRCVVLLGEPGIGKSHEWQRQQTRLAGEPGHLFVNLGEINSEEALRREILESVTYESWLSSGKTLTLWLDSLDEGLLHLSVLQAALLRLLRPSLPVERLCLRILCRNAVWPTGFTEALARQLRLPESGVLPGEDEARLVLLLSPLSYDQVAQAAEAEGFPAEQFLAAVASIGAQPLAGRPVTLRLLLNLYRQHHPTFGLPEAAGRAGLYERGCLELCERPDRERPEAHRPDPGQRLLLAGYVALLAVLTNRRVLAAEPLPGTPGANELDVYALSGGATVPRQGVAVSITVPALRDLFKNTGLFADMGQGQLVWAHQSYAEFLAAWYLHLADLPVASLRPLFRSAADPAGGLVPALRETAAWLADLQPVFWDELLTLDPVVLLQGDLRRQPAARRAQLVTRLLDWLEGRAYPPYQSTALLAQLAHPGLADQLLPLLSEADTPSTLARFATALAQEAQVTGLRPLLLTQALDSAAAMRVRNRALYILYELADEATRTTLRPLRHQAPTDEATEELRGHLLHLLWPSHLRLEELLPLLVRRRDRTLGGPAHYVVQDLERGRLTLSRDSLLASLRWLTQYAAHWRDNEEKFWQQLALYLQHRAWEQVEDPEIAAALAEAIVAATANYHPFAVGGTAAQRLAMLERLLPYHQKLEYHDFADNSFSANKGPTLIRVEDWSAVMDLLVAPRGAATRAWLADLLHQLLQVLLHAGSPLYTGCFEQLYRAARRYRSVRGVLARWLAATDLEAV